MVKILNSVFQGPVAKLLQKIINADFPGFFKLKIHFNLKTYYKFYLGVFKYFTGYFAMLVRNLF